MKKIITAVVMLSIVIAIVLQSFGLAWMSDNGMSSPIDITANVHKSYFASGDGTAEIIRDENGKIIHGPYEIATPLQLYYFSWLQYLGFFNQDSDGDDDIDTTYYFRLSADLDMYTTDNEGKAIQYVIPPIGTTDNPFIGNFDGEGHTIKNLVIQNQYSSLVDPPDNTSGLEGAEIIGCFGVVGELVVENPKVKYNYKRQANEVKNVILEDLTVKTETEYALIGLVAGYVNGYVDRVGVVSSTVDISAGTQPLGYTNNMSDYSLIGFCTEQFRESVYFMNLYINAPGAVKGPYEFVPEIGGEGSQSGWGGSVAMSDIFGWLDSINDTAQATNNTNSNYYIARTDVYDLSGKPVTVNGFSEIGSKPSYSTNTTIDSTKKFGTFVFGYTMGAMQGTDVNFVGGAQKVTEFKYVKEDNTSVPVYRIKRGNNEYLVLNNGAVQTTSSASNATTWYMTQQSGEKVFFTVQNNVVYYLNGSLTAESALNVNHDDLPSWNASGNNSYQTIAGVRLSYRYSNNNTTYYLVNNSDYTDVTTGTSETIWTITNVGDGWTVSTTDTNGKTYYLSHASNSDPGLSDTMNSNTTWQYSKNNSTITLSYSSSSGWFSTTYYLRFNYSNNRASWTISSSNSNTSYRQLTTTDVMSPALTVEESGTKENVYFTKNVYIDDSLMNRYYDENGKEQTTGVGITYFPLSSAVSGSSYDPDANNTGYIIGAGWGLVDALAGVEERIENDSNIRISEYSNNLTNDGRTPYTITYQTYQKYGSYSIPLPALVDQNGNQISKDDLTSALTTVDGYRLTKYADCYYDYYGSIDEGYCYGLHFMKASVTDQNTTRIDAYLRGEWIDNYEVPLNCIDFNLYDRGFINFVAGSYYNQSGSVNDSFFSIYEIVREGKDIKEIREIYKIYGEVSGDKINTGVKYDYTYVAYDENGKYEADAEGNRVTGGIAGKTMIFDCSWITNPTEYPPQGQNNWGNNNSNFLNQSFYFEVPVNDGEYAIGSTKGKTGAYLIYLDLAANAQLVEREKSYEEITEGGASATIPKGVGMLDPDEDGFGTSIVKPADSAFVTINNGTSGSIKYDKDGNVISHTATSGTAAEYIGAGVTLVDGTGNVMKVPADEETVIYRTTYRDNNFTTGTYTVTVIDEIHTTVDGVKKVKFTKDVTVTYPVGHKDYPDGFVEIKPTEKSETEPLYPDAIDGDDPELSAGDPLIDIAFAYGIGADIKVTVTYLYTPAVKDEDGSITTPAKYLVTIKNSGTDPVKLKAVLTELGKDSGITFVITDGITENVLTNTTDSQLIIIEPTTNGGGSGGETGGETGGEGA